MALTDIRVQRWAHTLVHYCLDVQPAELVGIHATSQAEPLIREVMREVLRVGAHPVPVIAMPSLRNVLLESGSDEQLQWRSPVDRVLSSEIHKRLRIASDPNPLSLATIDPARQAIANTPPQINVQDGKKTTKLVTWCGTLWPTEGYAQLAGMSLGDFEEFVMEACFLNDADPAERWRKLGRQQQRYVDWLKGRHHVHVRGEGIDLQLDITDRTFINSDGKRNFPSGEFFTGPVENSVEGFVHFDFPSSRDGRIVRDAYLRFEKGRAVEARASEGEAFLNTMLDIDAGARYLGEFAFGNNFGIDRAIINTLYDEKIGGTIHMALGESYPETGGQNRSAIHWDFIKDLRQGGEVIIDGITFMKDGQFVVPELTALAD